MEKQPKHRPQLGKDKEKVQNSSSWENGEEIWVLETNMDDCSGEALGYVMEKLMNEGANDACYCPVFMKKNRPAYLLKVICTQKLVSRLEDIIFEHTTTLGIRKYPVQTTRLERRRTEIDTKYGRAEVKVVRKGENIRCYPEYESVKRICEKERLSFQDVYYEVKKAFEKTAVFRNE